MKLQSHSMKITTLSPLFIGGDKSRKLSPYTDVIQDGDVLLYIDHKKLEKKLEIDLTLVDKFVRAVRDNMDNNQSTFSLQNFVERDLKSGMEEITARRVPITGELKKNQVECFIGNAGTPYIPGSSLKGAIRTAILYDWMLKEQKGKETLDKIRSLVNDNGESALKYYKEQDECFGVIRDDKLRLLRVTDSELINKDMIYVSEVKRFSLEVGQVPESSIPQWRESLPAGVETSVTISTVPEASGYFSFLNQKGGEELFKIINSFSLASVKHELEVLPNTSELNRIRIFYQRLETLIPKLRNAAIVRLGGGKTYFDNSIGLSLVDDENLFRNFIGLLLKKEMPFPRTRSFEFVNDIPSFPLGWLIISESREEHTSAIALMSEPLPQPVREVKEQKKIVIAVPAGVIKAEVVEVINKVAKVKLLEGKNLGEITAMPGIRIENLGITVGTMLYVKPVIDKAKKIVKAEYFRKID